MDTAQSIKLWQDAPPEVLAFTEFLLRDAAASGVTVNISQADKIAYPNAQQLTCTGYFVGNPGQPALLGAAVGGSWQEAFPILVHEYAHLTQWREQARAWTDVFDANGVEAADRIDAWLAGKDMPDAERAAMFRAARGVEMDAEKRVLAMVAAHNLPIDAARYARAANAYVLYYHHVEATRHWRDADTTPPYRNPEVYDQAPDTLGDPGVVPPRLAEAFVRAYGPVPEDNAWPPSTPEAATPRPTRPRPMR